MKRTVLRKRWVSGESAVGQVVESELCTTAPGGLLSRDFHAVSLAEFHLQPHSHRCRSRRPLGGKCSGRQIAARIPQTHESCSLIL